MDAQVNWGSPRRRPPAPGRSDQRSVRTAKELNAEALARAVEVNDHMRVRTLQLLQDAHQLGCRRLTLSHAAAELPRGEQVLQLRPCRRHVRAVEADARSTAALRDAVVRDHGASEAQLMQSGHELITNCRDDVRNRAQKRFACDGHFEPLFEQRVA